MKDLRWIVNRVKAMTPKELLWRIQQNKLVNHEKKTVFSLHIPVTRIPLEGDINNLNIDIDKLSINWDNDNWSEFSNLDLFGIFSYQEYKKKWNAGFQTKNVWPEDLYSPTLNISQRVDIGDIRTNWELNRHFQFAALAKSYYCTKNTKYLSELKALFSDWNNHNLFLHGVEWTSAMELAIRVNSWVYTFVFLRMAGCNESLLGQLEHGIFVMTDYIMKHHARFSSANNHLIIEMYAVALVGILSDYAPWKDCAINVLTEELLKQNYYDGVNKEMSLHYQSLVMEAYGLLWLTMLKNKIEIPFIWKRYLTAMTEFIADSTDDYGVTMEFGDNDEGKILDLNGTLENHYQYVMNMMSCILDEKYTESAWHENLDWIVPESLKKVKNMYVPKLICCRKEGGYTFLRSIDRRVLIGIDHADLGYESIAAHGHADALSFQLFIEGHPVFVDSGTYNYHITPKDRNYFRSTAAHNAVMIDGREQSDALGPFLWGRQYRCEIRELDIEDNIVIINAKCITDKGVHNRKYIYNFSNTLEVLDDIDNSDGEFFLHIGYPALISDCDEYIQFECGENTITVSGSFLKKNVEYSDLYNQKKEAVCIYKHIHNKCKTTISIMSQQEALT